MHRFRETNHRYAGHFLDLLAAGILQEVDDDDHVTKQRLKFVSTYFAVPKDEHCSRSIFNGKEVSKSFRSVQELHSSPAGEHSGCSNNDNYGL